MSSRISVVVPAYNRSHRLLPTLQSVLQQTHRELELIVVDDGSTDDTAEVVRSLSDPRITLLPQENQGCGAARNTGLARASGEWIAFLDHDDRWQPEKLRRQLEAIQQEQAILVYAGIEFINEEGEVIGAPTLPTCSGRVYHELLTRHNFVFTMSNPLMRTDDVRAVGGLDPDAGLSDDWDLFLKLARRGTFRYLDGVMVQYNLGNEQAQTRRMLRVHESELRLLRRVLAADPDLPASVRTAAWADFARRFAPAFREHGWRSLREGDCRTAWKHYREAIRLRPAFLRDPVFLRDLGSLLRGGLRGRRQEQA